jgi:deoxyribodipyrimidine photo-lyase
MTNLVLFWHRRDLRLNDNLGLAEAQKRSSKIVGVFCLDPNILESGDVAPVRMNYLIGCLQALQQDYAQVGSQLLILKASPQTGLPKLAVALHAQAVVWNRDVEPYAHDRDRTVTDVLRAEGITVCQVWDQLLHAPDEIQSGTGQPYTVYTPFWRNWNGRPKLSPVAQPTHLTGLEPTEQTAATAAGVCALPTAKDLGFVWTNELILPPGTAAAHDRLAYFCDRLLGDYQEQRNFPGIDGTSQLSAALKFGVIGIRTVWEATTQVLEQARSDEARASIQTWRQELAWREFYQHVMFFFPELAAGPYRSTFKNFPWQNDQDQFQAWCAGQTGYPIVDAAMRQLNESGWMHNRCRMIVASFLTKDLLINPQWGEKYFEQTLIDWDLSANNGGWQWSASSGMDPKPLRIFNPASQAQKFDLEADYIRRWLPELRGVETEALVSGKISPLECHRCNYPQPIVDHNQQQRLFKSRYQAQKEMTA